MLRISIAIPAGAKGQPASLKGAGEPGFSVALRSLSGDPAKRQSLAGGGSVLPPASGTADAGSKRNAAATSSSEAQHRMPAAQIAFAWQQPLAPMPDSAQTETAESPDDIPAITVTAASIPEPAPHGAATTSTGDPGTAPALSAAERDAPAKDVAAHATRPSLDETSASRSIAKPLAADPAPQAEPVDHTQPSAITMAGKPGGTGNHDISGADMRPADKADDRVSTPDEAIRLPPAGTRSSPAAQISEPVQDRRQASQWTGAAADPRVTGNTMHAATRIASGPTPKADPATAGIPATSPDATAATASQSPAPAPTAPQSSAPQPAERHTTSPETVIRLSTSVASKPVPTHRTQPDNHGHTAVSPPAPVQAMRPLPPQAIATAISQSTERPVTRIAPARDGGDNAPLTAILSMHGTASGQTSGPATATRPQPPLDLRQDAGLDKMIDHIETLRSGDGNQSRIRLTPDALGSVDVSVRRDGDRVHVQFTTANAAAHSALADAAPRLAQLADARGIRLGQTGIDGGAADHGQPGQHQAHDRPSQPLRNIRAAAAESADGGDEHAYRIA